MRWILFISIAAAIACGIPSDGPQMLPSADCMSCHTGDVAPAWTVAGTLYSDPAASPDAGLAGAQVLVTDSAGRALTLTTNGAGNFFTSETLTPPLHVQAQFGQTRMAMSSSPPTGSCNTCHGVPAQDHAPGRLFVPQ